MVGDSLLNTHPPTDVNPSEIERPITKTMKFAAAVVTITALSISRRFVVAAFSPVGFRPVRLTIRQQSAATTADLSDFRNKNNIDDQVFSAISGDGGIKITVATVRNLVNDVMMMHTMTAVPADALGRLMTCGLLMSNGMQAEQTVQITMNGEKGKGSTVATFW